MLTWSKSCCAFLEKCFNIKTNTINNSPNIESQDLNRYLFADESSSFKNKDKASVLFSKDKKILKFKKSNKKPEHLGEYEPPKIGTCDSFISIDSGDSNSDIDSDEEPKQINIKKKNLKNFISASEETYFL